MGLWPVHKALTPQDMGPSYSAALPKLICMCLPWAAALPALPQHSSVLWVPLFRHSFLHLGVSLTAQLWQQ